MTQKKSILLTYLLINILLSPSLLHAGNPDVEIEDRTKHRHQAASAVECPSPVRGNEWTQEKEDHLNRVLAYWGLLFY